MRRDLFFIYDAPVISVYNAYRQAVKTVFGKDADSTDFHSITFGLNLSFKYNMNGGACHIHLMPYKNGTAVGVRYSIAQLVGARYQAHCKDMANEVEKILGVISRTETLDMEEFLKAENKVVSVDAPYSLDKSTYTAQSTDALNTPKKFKFCAECGTKLDMTANFCVSCGKKQ